MTVAEQLRGSPAGGTCYVDLVPVTDAPMLGAALAGALGFGEQPGRSPADTVVARLADSELLLVLDNCEHLLEGVSALVERLLTDCPGLVVLATSRARMRVPFEFVFPVSGMSLGAGGGSGAARTSDATVLFLERAAMTGWVPARPGDQDQVAAVCRRLEGVALAIELAAARVATLGIDGLAEGLDDQLGLLTGGSRVDQRHRSVRSALDWSLGLLSQQEQATMRRVSVFAAPFGVTAAVEVAGFTPLAALTVPRALATLVEHHLLVPVDRGSGGRYRMLEVIRQYGTELMDRGGERDVVRARHLRWCLDTATRLLDHGDDASFDDVADDLRAALALAAGRPEARDEAHWLAGSLAQLVYARGGLSEAQERYEEAARLASDPAGAAHALHLAAAVAWGRHAGNDALRLYRASAEAATRAGRPVRAALELAKAAQLITNAPGIMSELPDRDQLHALLGRARALAVGDVHLEAAVLTVTTATDESDPAYEALAGRAVELAHRVGDARLESHALDQLTAVHLLGGEYERAVTTIRRRLELLEPLADDVEMAWEYSDSLHMAPMVFLAAGDLPTARRHARRRSELPFLRGSDHLAVEWLLTTAAIAGEFDEVDRFAKRFQQGWVEAGRPPLGGIAFAPAAAAMAYGICGDDAARSQWLEIATEMHRVVTPFRRRQTIYRPAFDAMVALHRGDVSEALEHLAGEPESFKPWHDAAWRPWYTAVWAETAVLAALPDRAGRLDRARFLARSNPIASAMVERAVALDTGDDDALVRIAADLHAAGCPYQRARTLALAGGTVGRTGTRLLAALGAAPMVVPG
jgi:predicted ATPase